MKWATKAVAAIVIWCLFAAGSASAYRPATSGQLRAFTVIGSHVVGSNFERLRRVRVADDGHWASALTEAKGAKSRIIFFQEAQGVWFIDRSGTGCLYPKNLHMPTAVALELGACKERSPEVWEDFSDGASSGRHRRPRTLHLVNHAVRETRWRRWGEPVTIGMGILPLSSCLPNCAQEKVTYWTAEVRLSRIKSCFGILFYTRLRIRLPRTSNVRPITETISCGRALGRA